MTHPLAYYVSAPRGTRDALILKEIESKFGSYLEELCPAKKSAWLIVLVHELMEIEIKVDFYVKEPIPEILFHLSDGCKLDLAVAVLQSLRKSTFVNNQL